MALNIQSQLEAINTSPGTQTITIDGFGSTPVAAMFVWSQAAGADDHVPDGVMSIGFYDGTRSRCWGLGIEDGLENADTYRVQSDASCGLLTNLSPGGVEAAISGVSFTADSVTINVDTAPGSGWLCQVTLFGGTDIANAYCNHKDDLGTGTSAVNITDPTFQADLVLCAFTFSNVAITGDDSAPNGFLAFGAWSRDDATQMMCSIASSDGSANSDCTNYFDADKGIGQIRDSGVDWLGTFGSHENGFTVTPSASSGSDIIGYLAIEWATTPSVEIVESTLPSSAADWTESGFTFEPEFGLVCMSSATADGTRLNGSQDMVFAISTIESGQVLTSGVSEEGNATTMVASSWARSDFFLGDPDGTATLTSGSLSSIQSGGWTMGISGDHDSIARKGWSLGIKAAAAAGTNHLTLLGVS